MFSKKGKSKSYDLKSSIHIKRNTRKNTRTYFLKAKQSNNKEKKNKKKKVD